MTGGPTLSLLNSVSKKTEPTGSTHPLLAYADVRILGGSVHTIKKNIETVVVLVGRLDWKEMLAQLSTWSCLEIRILEEVTV